MSPIIVCYTKAASDIKNQTNSDIGEYALAGAVGAAMGAMAGFVIVAAPYTVEALAFKSIMTIPSSMFTPAMIPIINGGASFLTYGLAFSNLMFRYYDVMEFAIGQNDLKDLLCEILGSENGLSTYNTLDFLTFLASLQMIMSGIVISQSQANNANNIAQKAAYQNPADEGDSGSSKTLDDILSNKTLTNQTGKVDNYVSIIKGEAAARADFNAMNPTNVRTYPNGTIVDDLPEGCIINIHPSITLSGAPSLEIYNPVTGTSIIIRY